jgi:hypothetical protein
MFKYDYPAAIMRRGIGVWGLEFDHKKSNF